MFSPRNPSHAGACARVEEKLAAPWQLLDPHARHISAEDPSRRAKPFTSPGSSPPSVERASAPSRRG